MRPHYHSNAQERVRQLHQELLHLACEAHPTARVLDALGPGLSSKNTRTRCVCTDTLREALHQHGVGVLQGMRSRPLHTISRVLPGPVLYPEACRERCIAGACAPACGSGCACAWAAWGLDLKLQPELGPCTWSGQGLSMLAVWCPDGFVGQGCATLLRWYTCAWT